MRKYVWDSHTFYANPCISRAQVESHHDDTMMTEGTHCLFGLINWFYYSVFWISEQVRPTHLFKQQEDAWHEQRAYFTHALAALGPSSQLAAAIRAGTAALDALGQSNTTALARMTVVPQADWAQDIRLRPADGNGHGLSLRLSMVSGGIVSLMECSTDVCEGSGKGAQWASDSQPLGRFVYRSRSYESGVRTCIPRAAGQCNGI